MKVTTSMTAVVVKVEMSTGEAIALKIIAGKLSRPKISELVPSTSKQTLDDMNQTNENFYNKLSDALNKGWG